MDERTAARLDEALRRWCVEVDGCLVWTGSTLCSHRTRHPRVHLAGRGYYVRRLVWERDHGPIPAGMTVRVSCGNDLCVRDEHLHLEACGRGSRARYVPLLAEPPAPPARLCPECGSEYVPRYGGQVYCRDTCQAAHERRADMLRKRRCRAKAQAGP